MKLLAVAAALSVFGVLSAVAEPVSPVPEAALGRADAPVTVIEYSSLGCNHCATFHADVLPRLKSDYVDSGKVRWIFRDFPLGQLPLAGALAARCAGPAAYPGLMDILFRSQETWMVSADPIAGLEKTVRQAGIGKERLNACLDDQKMMDAILGRAQELQRTKVVTATPTFLVNGERVVGMNPYENFAAIIDRHLSGAAKTDRPK
jgi:protein-disulfide isomerase